jgi:LPXTG-motif cell wall-anchored protein
LLLICLLFALIQSAGAITPPSPLSPGTSYEPGEIIHTLTPTLRWSSGSGADYYTLAISKYPYQPDNIVYKPQRVYGTSITVPGNILVVGEKYRWTMQAHNSAGASSYSWTLYFTPDSDTGSPAAGSPGSSYDKTSRQGSRSSQTDETGQISSGSTSGGGDNFSPYIILGAVCAIIAGGGFFILKRKNIPQVSSQSPPPPLPYGTPPPPPVTSSTAPGSTPAKSHHDVFISYAQVNKPVADAVCAKLESRHIRCWIAPRDVPPGKDFPEAIIDGIEESRVMVLIFSSHSNKSRHVLRELTTAVKNELMIIPFRIENVEPTKSMEYLIGLPHWLDAITDPLEKHLDTLVNAIENYLSSHNKKTDKGKRI